MKRAALPGVPDVPERRRALRRARIGALAVTLILVVPTSSTSVARAGVPQDLRRAIAQLEVLEGRIARERQDLAVQQTKVDATQRELNRLAVAINAAQTEYARIRAELAADVEHRAGVSGSRRDGLALLARQRTVLARLHDRRETLDIAFDEQTTLLHEREAILYVLTSDQIEVTALIDAYREQLMARSLDAAEAAAQSGLAARPGTGPMLLCPVDQPRAYGDSFGAPRYSGGYHPHAGTDILAPEGTPVRATFDGLARDDANGLGGNAVIVDGAEGWTYNAHLSAYGELGPVRAGDVIGYVGATGNAAGGPPHDHFEWHPDVIPADPYESVYGYTVIGDAIDPYPYLNAVC